MDNTALKADEIQALSAIYGSEWICEDETNNVYSITLRIENNCNESQLRPQSMERAITLQFRLPDEYPLDAPPFYTLSAPWMSRFDKSRLMSSLEEIYCEHAKESILYIWVEKAREFLTEDNENECIATANQTNTANKSSDDFRQSFDDESQDSSNGTDSSFGTNEYDSSQAYHHQHQHQHYHQHSSHAQTSHPHSHSHHSHADHHNSNVSLYHGEPFVDRRSTFQAHLSPVHCVAEAQEALTTLKNNKKIASATHNISAYRISGGPHNTCLQDCDDDGENHAGSRLLHLLQILDVKDVVVVVSRWYGGIQLGPDRFKHINNAARDLLRKCGYIDSQVDDSNQSAKNKKKSK